MKAAFLRSYNKVRKIFQLPVWCLHGTCRTEGCCSRTDGDLFPSTYPFPGLLPELLPGLESAGGQLWVNGGRWVRRCSGFALPLCWAVSKKHQASKEWIFCRFADLTELLSLIARKAAGKLFCIPHGKHSLVFGVESSHVMVPAAIETQGSSG